MIKQKDKCIEIYKDNNSIIKIVYGIISTIFFSNIYLIFFRKTNSIILAAFFGIFVITGITMMIKGLIEKNKKPIIEAIIGNELLEIYFKEKEKKIKYSDIKNIYYSEKNTRILILEYNKNDEVVKELVYITGMNTDDFIKEVKTRI